MAEFCLHCFNELNGTKYQPKEVWLEEGLCEGCGEWKLCVMDLRPKPLVLRAFDAVRSVRNKRQERP